MVNLFNVMIFSAALLAPALGFATKGVPLRLSLNWKAEPQFGGFYAAELNKEFIKRDLNVQIQEGGSGTPTVQMLAAGQTDFAIVSAEEILIARERGSDVRALFAVFQTNPQAIMTHSERKFQSLKEVFATDGILALQSGLSFAQFLFNKYPQRKVKIVPDLGGITNFRQDPKYSQQCFFTSEPLLAEKAGLKTKTFLISDEGFNPYTTVVATSSATLKKNPKLVKDFIEAVRAGWVAYLQDPVPANKVMAKFNPAMDLESFAKSASAQKDLIATLETKMRGLGVMSTPRWNTMAAQLKELKIIKTAPPAAELYENF
jgi:NitT/TauT family transport system substrate-binding protein